MPRGIGGQCRWRGARTVGQRDARLDHAIGRGSPELDLLLDRACAANVIDEAGRVLLTRLLSAIDEKARNGSIGGLTSHGATSTVAAELGVSPRTVRRRAHRAVAALTDAYAARIPA